MTLPIQLPANRLLRYAITSSQLFPGLPPCLYLRHVIEIGADIVQWREPLTTVVARRCLLENLGPARRRGVLLLVNSDVELALESGIDGVHLKSNQSIEDAVRRRPRETGRGFLIGQSIHSIEEGRLAAAGGADYVLLSPIYAPRSKARTASPVGESGLARAASELPIPVIGLGGIDRSDWEKLLPTGAAGLAGISWVQDELAARLG